MFSPCFWSVRLGDMPISAEFQSAMEKIPFDYRRTAHILTKIYAKQFSTSKNVDFTTLSNAFNLKNVGI